MNVLRAWRLSCSPRMRALGALLASASLLALPAGARAAVPSEAYGQLRWRQLGPYRAGWATVAAGIPESLNTYYFGGAGGGIWRTDDAGRTWKPLMQHERAAAIGALAIAPSAPRVLYAGTGQAASRYDVMAGDGVYRSDDGGTTWRHAGLEATRHIGAILVDPHDPDRVLVAALGHAFGPNPERGVYRSRDGGRTWVAVLQAGDSVGAVSLAWDPGDTHVVYAATWQRRMHPWLDYFQPQLGPGSGIWRSVDAGEHWTRLVRDLPEGAVGRIALAVVPGSRGRAAYAVVAASAAARRADGTAPPGAGLYATHDGGDHWSLVNPDGSLSGSYISGITVAPDDSACVYVMGQSIRCSHDGGAHFTVMRGSPGGDDYHGLWINPRDPRAMISASDQGAAVSVNGGASWSSWYNQPTGQFYHLAADDQFPYHVYSGQQDNGTVEIASRGPYGVIEERDWHPVGGDERDDMVPRWGDPGTVFGSGLGGGVSRFDEATHQVADVAPWPIGSYGARPTSVRYRYGWITPLAVSEAPPHALYLGGQLLFRSLDDGAHWDVVSPDLSGKQPGAGPCDAPEPLAARACGFGVIASIAPSPLDPARIWVGTDDGLIHLTTDGGAHWADVTPPELPAWGIVFAIDASALDPATAYAAVDLHRLDRHAPLLLRTHDAGRHWTVITHGLPADEFTSVVRADPVQGGLLFAGTNRAVYVSFDDGDSWQDLSPGLPTTWMRDLLPHAGDLVLATQGRGLWVLDDVTPLREAAAAASERVHLCAPAPAVRVRTSESHDTPWPPETPLGENPPTGAVFDYWLASAASGSVTLVVADSTGAVVRRFSSADTVGGSPEPYFERAWIGRAPVLATGRGMHRFVWDLRAERPTALSYRYSIAAVRSAGTPVSPLGSLVLPGRYTVALTVDGTMRSRAFDVRLDPRVRVTMDALREQWRLGRAGAAELARAVDTCRAIQAVRARRGSAGPPALADSLSNLSDRGEGSLANVAGTLSSLLGSLDTADAGPSQGLREAIADCNRRIDGLLARWARLAPGLSPPNR